MVSEPSIRGELKQVILLCERVLDQLASLKSSAATVTTEELDANSDTATINSTKLATAMPPTCSILCSNHDIDVLTPVTGAMSSSPLPEGTSALVPKSVAPYMASSSPRIVDAALDIVLSTAISCTTTMPMRCSTLCSTNGHISTPCPSNGTGNVHDTTKSLPMVVVSAPFSVPTGPKDDGMPRKKNSVGNTNNKTKELSVDEENMAFVMLQPQSPMVTVAHKVLDETLVIDVVLVCPQEWVGGSLAPNLFEKMPSQAIGHSKCMEIMIGVPTLYMIDEMLDKNNKELHEKTPHFSDLHDDNRKQSLNVDNKVSYQVFHEWPPDRAPIEDVGVTIQIVNEMPHDRGEKLSSSGATGLQQPWPPPSQYFSTIFLLSNHCVGNQQEFVLWELNPWLPPVREDRSSRTEVRFLQCQPCFMKNDGGTRLLPPWPSDQAIRVKSMVVEMGMSPENLLLHQPWLLPTLTALIKMSYPAPLQIVEMKPWPPPRRGSCLLFSSITGTQDEFGAVLKHHLDHLLAVQNSSNQHEWKLPQLLLVYLVMVINNCNASCRESNHGNFLQGNAMSKHHIKNSSELTLRVAEVERFICLYCMCGTQSHTFGMVLLESKQWHHENCKQIPVAVSVDMRILLDYIRLIVKCGRKEMITWAIAMWGQYLGHMLNPDVLEGFRVTTGAPVVNRKLQQKAQPIISYMIGNLPHSCFQCKLCSFVQCVNHGVFEFLAPDKIKPQHGGICPKLELFGSGAKLTSLMLKILIANEL